LAGKHDDRLWVDAEALLQVQATPADLGLAIRLAFEVWLPTKQAFHYDAPILLERLRHTAGNLTIEQIEAAKEGASKLFTILSDGRWAPSPEFFSLTDGNEDGDVV
jgi:hypothetical protein